MNYRMLSFALIFASIVAPSRSSAAGGATGERSSSFLDRFPVNERSFKPSRATVKDATQFEAEFVEWNDGLLSDALEITKAFGEELGRTRRRALIPAAISRLLWLQGSNYAAVKAYSRRFSPRQLKAVGRTQVLLSEDIKAFRAARRLLDARGAEEASRLLAEVAKADDWTRPGLFFDPEGIATNPPMVAEDLVDFRKEALLVIGPAGDGHLMVGQRDGRIVHVSALRPAMEFEKDKDEDALVDRTFSLAKDVVVPGGLAFTLPVNEVQRERLWGYIFTRYQGAIVDEDGNVIGRRYRYGRNEVKGHPLDKLLALLSYGLDHDVSLTDNMLANYSADTNRTVIAPSRRKTDLGIIESARIEVERYNVALSLYERRVNRQFNLSFAIGLILAVAIVVGGYAVLFDGFGRIFS